MAQQDPLEIIENLTDAINRGDLDKALSLYEHEAVLIAQPNNIVQGRDAISTALQEFISLKPILKGKSHKIVETGNLAFYCSKWILTGTSPDGKKIEMTGTSSDVLRRQPDGKWLIAIDNPWGTDII
jgi:uncharacterized protein (TIGR02246 family)